MKRILSALAVLLCTAILLTGCAGPAVPTNPPADPTTEPATTAPGVTTVPTVSVPPTTTPPTTPPAAVPPTTVPSTTVPSTTVPPTSVPPESQPAATECAHAYETITHTADCENQGYTVYTCSRCGHSYTAGIVAAKGHSFSGWSVQKAASCTESGVQSRRCAVCGKTESQTISATGHSFDGGTVVKEAASCADVGIRRFVCTTCGHTYDANFKGGHSLVYSDAGKYYDCANCDFMFDDAYTVMEPDYAPLDPNSALAKDVITLREKSYTGPLNAWPERWFEYKGWITRGIQFFAEGLRYGETSGYDELYYLDKTMTQEDRDSFMADFNAFLAAFKDYYGWESVPVQMVYNERRGGYDLTYPAKDQYYAYKSQVQSIPEAKKVQVEKDQIAYYVHKWGLYDGMQMYNAIHYLQPTIWEQVAYYDWSLSLHDAFDGFAGGICVCDGYSEMFQLFADYLGIESSEVFGSMLGTGHAWNKVTFSDGTVRYVDITNGPVLATEAKMREDHTW